MISYKIEIIHLDGAPTRFLLYTNYSEWRILAPWWWPCGFRRWSHLFCAFADLETNTNQVTISSSNAPLFSTFTPSKKKPCIAAICSSVWFWPDMYVSIGILPCARNRWQFRLGQLMAYDLFCGDLAYDTTTCTFKKPTRPIQWKQRGPRSGFN